MPAPSEEYRRLKRKRYGGSCLGSPVFVTSPWCQLREKAFSHAFFGATSTIAIEASLGNPGRGGVNQCTESISAIIDKHRL